MPVGERSRAPRPSIGLPPSGYLVLPKAVPNHAIGRALDLLDLEKVPGETQYKWMRNMHPFPHLRWEPEIRGIAEYIPERFRIGYICEPQIVIGFRHLGGNEQEVRPHIDRDRPGWAVRDGLWFTAVIGVALTQQTEENGALHVWPLDGQDVKRVELGPGDAVIFDPRLPHSPGINRSREHRKAVYFRYVK